MPTATIIQSDALAALRVMQPGSVNCIVTSPPYWGLRDYSSCGCSVQRHASQVALDMCRTQRPGHSGQGSATDPRCRKEPDPDCAQCGGTGKVKGVVENQLGLEKTPEEYVAKMVEIFREARRVLRDDGTLWLNIGDSYASSWPAPSNRRNIIGQEMNGGKRGPLRMPRFGQGCKEKDLVGIPWMLAFALRNDGWYLRSDIIWHKPNAMPESVTDRPTKAHEYLFLMSKGERYHYDAEAIKEPATWGEWGSRLDRVEVDHKSAPSESQNGLRKRDSWKGSEFHDGKNLIIHPNVGKNRKPRQSVKRGGFNGKTNEMEGREAFRAITESRNKRTVWTIATEAFAEAHFATFPTALVKPCILAGCPAGGTVLDPFGGSGTTGQMALELGRNAVLIELNPAYIPMIRRRCDVTPGMVMA